MPIRKTISLIGAAAVATALTITLSGASAQGDPVPPLPSPSVPLPDVDSAPSDPALPARPGDGADGADGPGVSTDPAIPGNGSSASPEARERGHRATPARPRPADPDDPAGDLYPHPPFAPIKGNPSAALLQKLYDAQAEQRSLRNQIDTVRADLAPVAAAVSDAKIALADARKAHDLATDGMEDDVRSIYKSGAPYGVYTALEGSPGLGVIRDHTRARLATLATATDRLDLLSDQLAAAVDERDALVARLTDLNRALTRADTLVGRYLRATATDLATGVPNPGLAAGYPGGPLQWPVRGHVTSGYGNRYDPYYRRWQLHAGIDIAATAGTPVRAAAPGRVVQAGRFGGYGNYICVAHGQVRGQRLTTCYGHLSRILVTEDQPVGVGQAVGQVGSTGASTGPHLHFEVRVGGRPTNPRLWL